MPRLVEKSSVTEGKTTIPKAVRNIYNIKDKDTLEWFENGEEEIIVKKGEK